MSRRETGRWRFRTKLLVVLYTLCVAALTCEVVLWEIDYSYVPVDIDGTTLADQARNRMIYQCEYFRCDPELMWRPKKGYSLFNAQGFRGKELAEVKAPGEFRIFAIGDSNTLGIWQEAQDPDNRSSDWPGILDRYLVSAGRQVVVVNGGVWGYSSYQGLRRLEEVVSYRPDMVLIGFGGNCAHKVVVSDADYAPSIPCSAIYRARTAQLLLRTWRRLAAIGESCPPEELVFRVSPDEYRDNLNGMIALSREHDFQCVLLTCPFTGECSDPLWWKYYAPRYVDVTLEVGRDNAVPVIDLHSELENRPECLADEVHLTDEGYQVAARIICDEIEPLLP
jgi:lysophospholipase L1-like esterase